MFTLSPETIKEADKLAVEKYSIPELRLMKNAARSCFFQISGMITRRDRTVILCGKGNNGGDGYEIASLLKTSGYDVTVINVFECEPVSETALTVYRECLSNNVAVLPISPGYDVLKDANVIIDAVFGVGFYGSIDENSSIGKLIAACKSRIPRRTLQ